MARIDSGGAIFASATTLGGRFVAFGKFLLFLVATFLLMGGVYAALFMTHLVSRGASMHSAGDMLLNEVVMSAAALIVTLALAAIFREPIRTFGFGLPGAPRLRELGLGLVSGFVLLTLLLASIAILGGFSFGHISEGPMEILHFGLLYALLFALVAVAEEFIFRGYGLVQMTRAISFWPAALVMSVLFGAVHATNAGETPVGLFSAGAIGFVFAYSFYRSGSLMWALGFHAAWDYAQSFVWGVPDSGTNLPGALFTPSIHGAEWLTGGAVGPEGSWLILPIIAIAAIAAHVMLGQQRGLIRR